jgi:RNA polymerase sigma factor (sigma-70 family)
VFLLLSRKAPELTKKTIVSGWLFKTAHLVACNAVRDEARRKHYEAVALNETIAIQEAATMDQFGDESMLDDALSALCDQERNAVLLRYLQELSVDETASALGISQQAAQKRASRGLEHLRKFFAKSGSVLTLAAIAVLISEKLSQAAPEHSLNLALNIASGAIHNARIITLSQGALKQMVIIKIKIAACSIIGSALVLGTAAFGISQAQTAVSQQNLQAKISQVKAAGVNFSFSAKPVPADQDAKPYYLAFYQEYTKLPKTETDRANIAFGSKNPSADDISFIKRFVWEHPNILTPLDAATEKPYYSWKQFVTLNIQDFTMLRSASRIFKGKAYVEALNGQYDASIADQAKGFAVARHAYSEGSLIGALVSIAAEGITIQGMRDILAIAGDKPGVADKVIDAVQNNLMAGKIADPWEGQEFHGQWDNWEAFRTGRAPLEAQANPQAYAGTDFAKAYTSIPAYSREKIALEAESEYLDDVLELIKVSDLPYLKQKEALESFQHSTPGINQFAKFISGDSSQMLPTRMGKGVAPRYAFTHASEQLTLAIAAAFSAKAKTGEFPNALPKDFIDPLSDKPFDYQKTSDGFEISGLGGGTKNTSLDYRYPVPNQLN